MLNHPGPINITPCPNTIKRLKDLCENCHPRHIVEEMLNACHMLAESVGVQVCCEIVSDDPNALVDRAKLLTGLNHLAGAVGGLAAGGRFSHKEARQQHPYILGGPIPMTLDQMPEIGKAGFNKINIPGVQQ